MTVWMTDGKSPTDWILLPMMPQVIRMETATVISSSIKRDPIPAIRRASLCRHKFRLSVCCSRRTSPRGYRSRGLWPGPGAEGARTGDQSESRLIAPWAIVDSSCALTSDERLYAPVFDAGGCSAVTLRFSSFFEPGTEGRCDNRSE